MIFVLDRRCDISYPGVAATQPRVRLAFSPSSSADNVVNGGWWPRSRDPATELPALVAAVAERLVSRDSISFTWRCCPATS
jgi:hypothetical protein